MNTITSLDKFRVPIGNQEIELQQIEFEAGGVPLFRLRIREHTRFTIFDIDAATAGRWAQVMGEWAQQQLASSRQAAASADIAVPSADVAAP